MKQRNPQVRIPPPMIPYIKILISYYEHGGAEKVIAYLKAFNWDVETQDRAA